jgi:putative SOS response-associated peptidase YedK
MCGRFTQKSERKLIALEFYVQDFIHDVLESYNLAPGQDAGVIIHDDVNRYARYRWGLVPFWAKDPSIGNRMINARGETVAEKPSFKKAFAARRCLVPADGFYEWRKGGSYKTPFYIYHASGKPMSFAGLWETWYPKGAAKKPGPEPEPGEKADSSKEGGEPAALHTFTIITTEANEKLRALHDRMPVIIPPDRRETWLNQDTDPARLGELLEPLPPSQIEFHEVSRMVNSPKNNTPACIEPATK